MQTLTPAPLVGADASAHAAARRTLRRQIARLESELAEAVVTAFELRLDDVRPPVGARSGVPRLLDLGELERTRDELAVSVARLERLIADGAERQARRRELLSQLQLEPGRHRFTRIPLRELGQPGCGVWHVRPRFGIVGMLMGWWQVKLSSGCPLATGRRAAPARP